MTQWETPAILPNRNRAPPHPFSSTCPPSLLTKKCILCLLPRLSAINPGSTSDVALPPFPRVTALYAIIIAASLRVYVCVCVCVCVCVQKGDHPRPTRAPCMPVYRWRGGGQQGDLLDQRKPKSSYKKAMHSGRGKEGGRKKARERETETEGGGRRGKKLISFFSRAIHHRASQLQCHKLTE